MEEEIDNRQKALLVSVYMGSKEKKALCEEHLDELELLAETYGVRTVHKIPCSIRKYDAATFVTAGKLEEILKAVKEFNADLVIFDDEISPAQQRNLEKALSTPVMDRTEVILEVFAHRAQTKEAKLQIELARIKYEAPRLKRLWTHLSRQAGTSGGGGSGGGGYLKGEGEKQIEIDRRILKREIDQLQKELEEVRAHRDTQRASRQRGEIPVFSIIGYTNAGKSTLLNALTEAEVFVEDKLFATLDTTTRKFALSNNQEVLLTDTVGFIRKLPHTLVAAFKSTLEESVHADILLHVVDISHPAAAEQAATTLEVLKELGAADKPIITLLNKIDQCTNMSTVNRLRLTHPKTVIISALEKTGFPELETMMIQEIEKQRKKVTLRIPQSQYGVVTEVMRIGNILEQEYEGNDILLSVSVPISLANKLKKYTVSA